MPADIFSTSQRKIDGPARSAVAVTPSDSSGLDTTRAVYVGAAGDLKVQMADDPLSGAVTFKAVAAGSFLPIRVTRVFATGTTATSILALF